MMRHLSRLGKRNVPNLKRFFKDPRGATATIFAVMLVPLMISVAFAVEYNIISNHQRKIQSALDAATLATTNLSVESAHLNAVAEAAFYANLGDLVDEHEDHQLIIDTQDDDEYGRTIVLSYDTKIESAFGSLFGFLDDEKWHLVENSTANQDNIPLEISLVLDVSSSMNKEGRIVALREAANHFVDIVLQSSVQQDANRISIVPFGSNVMLSSDWKIFYNNDDPNDDPDEAFCLDHILKNGPDFETTEIWNGDYLELDHYGKVPIEKCPVKTGDNTVFPLHNDPDILKNKIANIVPPDNQATGGNVGLAFEMKLLSDDWQDNIPGLPAGVDNTGLPRDNDSDDVKKIMIFMTDGTMSHQQRRDGPDNKWNMVYYDDTASDYVADACDAAKDLNIVVYTIALAFNGRKGNITVEDTVELLQNCATSPSHAFEVENEGLNVVFETIARNAQDLALTH
ncbi:MAG: pilus assembly protein TadG-related protein [Methyloligellaceae bacterium]